MHVINQQQNKDISNEVILKTVLADFKGTTFLNNRAQIGLDCASLEIIIISRWKHTVVAK